MKKECFKNLSINEQKRYKRIIERATKERPALNKCDGMSIIGACSIADAIKLEPNTGLNYALLLPVKNKCNLYITSNGIMELALRYGEIKSLSVFNYMDKETNTKGIGGTIKLFDGFEKTLKFSNQEIKQIASNYEYSKQLSFEEIARKHVLKQLLLQSLDF